MFILEVFPDVNSYLVVNNVPAQRNTGGFTLREMMMMKEVLTLAETAVFLLY